MVLFKVGGIMTPEEKKAMADRIAKRLIENPKLLEELKDSLLDDEVVDLVLPANFKVWRTLKLGTGLKTADDFRKALKQSGNKVSSYANDLLEKIKAATEETEVDLCKLSVAELTGKKEVATTNEVFAGADRLGFEKCTPEVGPQLRIQYPDQPMGEQLLIGMDPISDRDGYPDVFELVHDGGGLWLHVSWAGPMSKWFPEDELVFRLRKFSKES